MKGHNKMLLNTATMMQIVQEWIDRNLTASDQNVTHVDWDSSERAFIVVLESKEPPSD